MTSDQLSALQLPNGGFESIVTLQHGRVIDCNGFTAGLVLRLTRDAPRDPVLQQVQERALGFVTTCASTVAPGAFAFWPGNARPAWAVSLPADVDDTAVMVTELLRHGWVDAVGALRQLCHAVLPCRVTVNEAESLPPWVAPGCFNTWIVTSPSGGMRTRSANLVDCSVNANVVALMSMIGAQHLPGYNEAIQTITQAVRWAGDDRRRLSVVTPFYPSPAGLMGAVEHAVECGAYALREVLDRLRALDLTVAENIAGCCCSAYGAVVWHCEALNVARELSRRADPRSCEPVPAIHASAS